MGQRTPNLYQRGAVWWCWFYDHEGQRVYRSTHQRDRSLAGAAARKLERAHIEAPASKPAPVDELIAAYLANCERKDRAASTLDFYLKKARPLCTFFGSRDANRITLAETEEYMDERLAHPRVNLPTIAKELGLLRATLRYAKRHQRYVGDVEAIIPEGIQGAYVPRDRALSHEEYERLLRAMDPDVAPAEKHRAARTGIRRDYLAAWCYTGVRESELYAVTPSDVVLEQDMLHVPGSKTDGSDRWVPIAGEARAMFERRADETGDGEPLFPRWDNVRRDLGAACERAGIDRVSPNDLRRTFATWLAEAGVPEAVAAALLGHASSAMVRRVYTRIGRAAQRAAVATLPIATVTGGVTDAGVLNGPIGQNGLSETEQPPQVAVPRAGIEPATRGFSVRASQAENASRGARFLKLLRVV